MIRSLFVLGAAALLMSSCAYTGDPNQGGLFGWSQGMADDRLSAREQRLRELDQENAYQAGRTSALEDERYRRQHELNKLKSN